ncbi:MAG: hypothetical protein ABL907_14715 [Hyphomicrobium sp.]
MRPGDQARAVRLRDAVRAFDANVEVLLGIRPAGHLDCLVEQLVDSLRRIEFVHRVRDGRHDPRRMEPGSGLFDPLKAAVLHNRHGNSDEAYWLVFLATHFGKHGDDGWRLVEDVYGRLGGAGRWDWPRTSGGLPAFRAWVAHNEHTLRGGDGVKRRFSNHRKYESLKANSAKGLPAVVESYVGWIGPHRTHQEFIRGLHRQVGQNPREVFAALYRSMKEVKRFGRLGKFDYLAMLGKLGIAPIDPDSAYLREATGPLAGARLLFEGDSAISRNDRVLDRQLVSLDERLNVGMQVLEDALCNWQKSPARHVYFRG